MRPFYYQLKMRIHPFLVAFILLLFAPSFTESCLPSWFRQTRSADPETPENAPSTAQKSLETNEIGEEVTEEGFPEPQDVFQENPDEMNEKPSESLESSTSTVPTLPPPKQEDPEETEEKLGELVKNLTEKEADYEYEYEEEKAEKEAGEALKYNEEATKKESSTLKPAVRREIEKLKEAKCRDYCHHNATCHVEVIFRDDRISAVVPSCHCPHGWEGTRCDRHYVQAFYAPVSGRYNDKVKKPKVFTQRPSATSPPKDSDEQGLPAIFSGFYERILQSSTSAVPAFAFLVIMLIMFIAIVVYAYRRMSKRTGDTTYTMSHMCPPEAFTVLKTPNGRKISLHQCSTLAPPTVTVTPVAPGIRIPMRQAAVRGAETNAARSNFFSILRSQGSIPSRAINEDDTPKHYKSVPRVEVSAINYSGHIDFSGISFQSNESEASKASSTCPPPSAVPGPGPHFVIQMEEKEEMETNFRSPSRSAGEPGSPTTCEPMIPPKS